MSNPNRNELGFPWNLHTDDEVFWSDPDEGTCSRAYIIGSIEYHGEPGDSDCIIRIADRDGSVLECYPHELRGQY